MASKFLILAFDHPFRVVESLGDGMAAGMHGLGIETLVLSIPRDLPKLTELSPDDVSGILSLGPLPLAVTINDQLIFEYFRCPVWLYLLDSPIYDILRLGITSRFFTAAYTDRRLVPVIAELGYRSLLGIKSQGGIFPDQTTHLPFACFPRLPIVPPPQQFALPQPRLCVIGTIGVELGAVGQRESLQEVLQRHQAPGLTHAARGRIADILLSSEAPAMPARAVSRVLTCAPDMLAAPEILPLLCAVDSWVKRQRRIAAVRSLIGHPVDFLGTGWKEIFGEQPGFRYLGFVRHQEIATAMTRYQGAVNFDPCWEHGLHDRVYTATAMGVNMITNRNEALPFAGLPSSLLHLYDAQSPDLGAIARRLLSAPPQPVQPQLDVLVRHGWTDRMARLLSGQTY